MGPTKSLPELAWPPRALRGDLASKWTTLCRIIPLPRKLQALRAAAEAVEGVTCAQLVHSITMHLCNTSPGLAAPTLNWITLLCFNPPPPKLHACWLGINCSGNGSDLRMDNPLYIYEDVNAASEAAGSSPLAVSRVCVTCTQIHSNALKWTTLYIFGT